MQHDMYTYNMVIISHTYKRGFIMSNTNINVEEKTATITHKTRCNDTPKALKGEENPCNEFVTTFDFSKCSESEILDLASKSCIISFRTKSKVNDISNDAFQKLMDEPINVHEAMKAERRGLSPIEKAEKLMTGMSEADVKALLEKLANKRA